MLRNLSKTRWSARAGSIQAVWTSFEVILDVLHMVTNKADVKTKTQALGLKKKMLSLDFVVALKFMKNIAYKTKSLVVQLQSVELNILDATGLVHGTLSILQKLRDDDKMIDDQTEASVIFTRNIEFDAEADFTVIIARGKHLDVWTSKRKLPPCFHFKLTTEISFVKSLMF